MFCNHSFSENLALPCAYGRNLVKSFTDVTLCNEAKRLLESFLQFIESMKIDQIEKASCAAFGKYDSISLLIKRKAETMKLKTLIPSSSTLIIVPNMLIPHWKVCNFFCFAREYYVTLKINYLSLPHSPTQTLKGTNYFACRLLCF